MKRSILLGILILSLCSPIANANLAGNYCKQVSGGTFCFNSSAAAVTLNGTTIGGSSGNTTSEMQNAINQSGLYYNILSNNTNYFNSQAASYYVALSNLVNSVGNWSADKSSYTATANLVSSLGNWSADKASYVALANLVASVGNWSADKSSYVLTTVFNSVGNWTNDKGSYTATTGLVSSIGNWSADKSSYATTANLATVGNWTADKSNYALLTYVQSAGNWSGNASSYTPTSGLVASIGNWSADKASYATITNLQSVGNWTADKPSYITTSTHWENYTTTNQTVQGTTALSNITGLTWNATANSIYTMNCILFFNSSVAASGLNLAVNKTGGALDSILYDATIYGVSATTMNEGTANTAGTKITSTAVTAVNTIYHAELNAYIKTNTNSPDINIMYGPEQTAAGNRTSILTGSYCINEKVV